MYGIICPVRSSQKAKIVISPNYCDQRLDKIPMPLKDPVLLKKANSSRIQQKFIQFSVPVNTTAKSNGGFVSELIFTIM